MDALELEAGAAPMLGMMLGGALALLLCTAEAAGAPVDIITSCTEVVGATTTTVSELLKLDEACAGALEDAD